MTTADPAGSNSLAVTPASGRDLAPRRGDEPNYYSTGGKSEISIGLLWRVAVEWRWLILSALAVGIAAAVIMTLLTPLKYRAGATIELNPPTIEVMRDKNGTSQSSSVSDPVFIGTQLGLLQSKALAERIAQDLNLAADPAYAGANRAAATTAAAGMIQGGLNAELQPQSRLIRLTFVSGDPALAARVVNGAADAYINTSMERRYGASSYARDFLSRQIAKTRADLEKGEREVVAYAQQERIINVGSGDKDGGGGDTSSLQGEALVSINSAYATAQARRFAAEQKYREALKSGPTTEASANTSGLKVQLATLNAQYEQKLKIFRPDYPEMQQLKAQIDALKGSIATEVRSAQADRAGSLRAEYLAAVSEEGKLKARVDQLSGSVLDLRGRSIRYTILQREVDTNRTLYDALLQRYKEVGVAASVGTANASIVDRAVTPRKAFSPVLSVNIMIGAALGLLAGMGLALLLEFVNDTIKVPEDVRNKLRLPFLGGIPPAKDSVPVEDLRDPLSGLSEAYLSTTTALQLAMEGGAPRTLVVTSTRAAEGKSTTAWALASSFARLGKRVLLIDADMRRPAFVTDQKAESGLSHLLTNDTPLADHITPTEFTNLFIMPAGAIPPSPPELLASPAFVALLQKVSSMFDQIVIDGPPILGLADAPLLSSIADGTLMVVEAGRTRTRPAVEALGRLKTAGAHVVGAILTRYQPQTSYGYGYGYGYGSKGGQYRYVADDSSRRRRILLTTPHEE